MVFEGVVPNISRRFHESPSEYTREMMSKYMTELACETCHGQRLSREALSVYVGDYNIGEVVEYSISRALKYYQNINLSSQDFAIANQILKEIISRLSFLNNVGLEYLTLNRASGSLSGGEAQRIRLATQIGSRLTGVLYVLDEPSIGLHQRDNDRLISTLKEMRDLGNTLIVVEHDDDTMREADYLVDIGPGAGDHGGEIVASGTPQKVMKNKKSLTGQYLSGKKRIDVPEYRRPISDRKIAIRGASSNNLKHVDVDIPLSVMTVVTGVSGSGKSSLVNEVLYKSLAQKINKSKVKPGIYDSIEGIDQLDKIIDIDQSPIGRTPRSNPATYTGVFDDIRDVFAQTNEAKIRGYQKGRFSFNVKGGRCEACKGDGIIKIEMHFLPDVYVPCEVCDGKRYNRETLEVTYKGKNIADVLNMTVEEATQFFENIPKISRKLQTLVDVGLGYVTLGQQATTLSGGEAQRVKLASELHKRSTGRSIYILDEPTTGLHVDDISRLLKVLNRLVENGDTVVIIEHNLDVIKTADHIIDLGPEGGDGGGTIVATGTPEEIAQVKASYTGKYLKQVLDRDKQQSE
ncbi:excinuclease ABC subunit A [Staphylococcus simiae CCM 7213 = CCUG 51256]|uniref:UvrABC system protein A n=2 Tax=Staphylococcus simiae TaxID=308354 RepID=G5JL01_9STAP|nr:excinuclease ABC subunit A [Staphylococcus simiae CCM 7213 = CCUG 51256]